MEFWGKTGQSDPLKLTTKTRFGVDFASNHASRGRL